MKSSKYSYPHFFLSLLVLVIFSAFSCGEAAADENEKAESKAATQEPFKKLTTEQVGDPCQWMPEDLVKSGFSFTNGIIDPPQKTTGFTNTCELVVKEGGNGVALSWQLNLFDQQEIYEGSLEAARLLADKQSLKALNLGKISTISHQTAGGGLTVSILQLHGSSYSLNLTSQYKGGLSQEQIEKAMVEIVQVFLSKHP